MQDLMFPLCLSLGMFAFADHTASTYGCPAISEVTRFPPLDATVHRYLRWYHIREVAVAKAKWGLDNDRPTYLCLVENCDAVLEALEALSDAQDPRRYTFNRRFALKRYRELIGREHYERGYVP